MSLPLPRRTTRVRHRLGCAAVALIAVATSGPVSAQEVRVLTRSIPESTLADTLQRAARFSRQLGATQSVVEFYRTELRTDVREPITFLLDFGPSLVRSVTMRRYDSPNGRFTWMGEVPEVPGSSIVFYADGDLAFGTLQLRDTIVSINQVDDSLAVVSVRVMAPEPPEEYPRPDTSAVQPDSVVDGMDVPPLQICKPLYVYVLVAYTPRAAANYERIRTADVLPALPPSLGLYSFLAVEDFNFALASAGIDHRLKLVDTVMVDLPDRGGILGLWETLRANDDLRRLRSRDTADIVAFWAGDVQGACGYQKILKAPQSSGSDSVFPVTRVREDCLGAMSFAHEIGHALGLAHDRETAADRPGAEPWAFGYRDTVGGFSTLMASSNCPVPTGCTRQRMLSHPARKIGDRAAGIDHRTDPKRSAMNAATVEKTMCAVARFSRY